MVFNFLRKIKPFYITSFIYIDENSKVIKNKITGRIKWLDSFIVLAKVQKEAEKYAFSYLDKKYSEYKGAIYIL